ncbi:unnamed protein product [Strongylus vulgaris]|uniref:Uncharacterized protein n=1 Tax=Strongylus vulgaris TaxID=40348 RepID=A0A3P7KI92_STRVU|nr:unnamed protein product [Strongylus vulgaris]
MEKRGTGFWSFGLVKTVSQLNTYLCPQWTRVRLLPMRKHEASSGYVDAEVNGAKMIDIDLSKTVRNLSPTSQTSDSEKLRPYSLLENTYVELTALEFALD